MLAPFPLNVLSIHTLKMFGIHIPTGSINMCLYVCRSILRFGILADLQRIILYDRANAMFEIYIHVILARKHAPFWNLTDL